MKLIQILADIICKTLLDPETLTRSRSRKGAFTRNCGKLPYWTLVKLLMSNVANNEMIVARIEKAAYRVFSKAYADNSIEADLLQRFFT